MAIAQPTTAEVKQIVGEFPDALVSAAIADAVLIVEDCVSSFTTERQTAIVKWVAAHLIVLTAEGSTGSAGAVRSEKLGSASVTYMRPAQGSNLRATSYGEQALLLDDSGCLARRGKASRTFKVL